MCDRAGIRSILLELLNGLEAGDREEAADADKAKHTLLDEYPPGTHPVLPEHHPYGLTPGGG